MSSHILPQGAGYGVVIGMGAFFSLLMIGITKIQARYTGYKPTNSEEFSSASRSVPPGLIAAGIVSAWTWAATLLQSSATAYKFGVSGPWWYASGATVQVLLFAMLAAKLKMNAPGAHTFLEIVRARWGAVAHVTFLCFGLATNIIVSTMLVLGGSATVSSLTGMNTVAACFLIPLGVSVYVLFGGMRATLIADYSHTLVLYCILIAFGFVVYATSDVIGSPSRMWELLSKASKEHPISGNAEGSYLTLHSKQGIIFGVLNLVGNFGTVFNDQAYWQRAIASQPQTSVKAFLWGGIAWFGIPLGIATTLGLASVALAHGLDTPAISLTSAEVGQGLPAVKAIAALAGKSGATAMLILLFLAVTSAASAEQIAVSSLVTYDVYGTYVNPHPSEKQVQFVSHAAVVGCALFMGAIATAFNYIGVSMGYLYELMGTIIGSAVVPVALCITWRRANGTGAVVGAIAGFAAGVAGWLGITARLNGGVINVDTTFGDYEMLTGNLLAIGVGGIVTVAWSLVRPADFDWDITRAINNAGERVDDRAQDVAPETPSFDLDEKKKVPVSTTAVEVDLSQNSSATDLREPQDRAGTVERGTDGDTDLEDRTSLARAFRLAATAAITLTLILLLAVPLPQFFTNYVYPRSGFTAWVCIVMLWLFAGLFLIGLYPIWEARHGLATVANGVWGDLTRREKGKGKQAQTGDK